MKIKMLTVLMLYGINVIAQDLSLSNIISVAENFQKLLPREKVYLHLDKPSYTLGDTIRVKAYALEGAFLTASRQSGILYIELANDTGRVVRRNIMNLSKGLGSGTIALNDKEIPEGSYTLRAYTSLMRNFGNEAIFRKDLYISSNSENQLLVASNSVLSSSGTKDSLRVALKFSRLDKSSVGSRNFRLQVRDGRKVYLRDEMMTSADGSMDFNFVLPESADPHSITLIAVDRSEGTNGSEIRIPLAINRQEHIDLQFMPESAYLVAGLPVRVGFKALGENGKGTEVAGSIYNNDNEKVADFAATHKGMGSFELHPQPGEVYTARIKGSDQLWPLPPVKDSGTGLRIINEYGSDSLDVFVTFSPGIGEKSDHYLIGQYGGVVCYAGQIKGNSHLRIPVNLFSSGIVRFTLMNSDRSPLNERVVFIDHRDELKITVKGDKAVYSIRDSVSLDIQITDKDGLPVQGSFSMAVTDDSQVKAEDSMSNTIRANMLLSSDLKGTIEEPGYYFQDNKTAWEDLDNLLLTQGWVGYEWPKVFNFAEVEYAAEPEFTVSGRVVNVLGKALNGAAVRLLSPRPFMLADALTDSIGQFRFDNFPTFDTTVIFRVQAKNLRGRNMNVGINPDEFSPPVFEKDRYATQPWYVNTDTVLINQIKSVIEEDYALMNLPAGAKLLDEVIVTAKKIIRGSKNLNGSGISDFAMSENEIVSSGKMSLLKLIQQNVPKFFVKYFPPPVAEYFYTINGSKVNIVIDGVPLSYFYTP